MATKRGSNAAILAKRERVFVGKGLSSREAVAKGWRKCKHDHRGTKYDKATGYVVFT